MMLDEFEKWFEATGATLRSQNRNAIITRSGGSSDKPSIRADIETPLYMARITLWDSGECEREAINIETGKTKFDVYEIVRTPQELFAVLETFLVEIS